MEAERPHQHNSTSELFICFTSRLSSSSSMKLSSKSILSPSRNREPSQISLSSSLSRRLRSNGSIKNVNGQASPMFPTNGKKRGCAFENPEPSSPKVTCIGQVRVKTKKQGKKMRARTKRRDASFRKKTEQGFSDLQNLQQEAGLTHRNQRWVHLPLTICEALRAFGAEFSCLFPCRSSSCGREKEEEEGEKVGKGEGSGGGQSREGSCGAAFARWLVALQEGDAKGREIELVVGEEHEEGEGEEDRGIDRPERSRRRHVFEDIEVDMEKKNEEEEEKARVSICVPPKNALLLMRCRSDPVKMAALANRFWESPAHKDADEGEEDEEGNNNGDDEDREEEEQVRMEEDEEVQEKFEVPTVQDDSVCGRGIGEREIPEAEAEAELEAKPVENRADPDICEATKTGEEKQEFEEEKEETKEDEEHEGDNANQKDETLSCVSSPEVPLDLERPELVEVYDEKPKEKENDEHESSELASSSPVASESDKNAEEQETAAVISVTAETAEAVVSVTAETSAKEASDESTEKEDEEEEEEEKEKETKERPWEDESKATQVRSNPKPQEVKPGPVLPDCLLLMMCEPKLSMEVSKETWVCSTDFIRWLPERPAKRKDGGDEPKKRTSVDSKPPLPAVQPMQPPRSSCSFPAASAHGGGMSMASMIEQKLVGSNAYEPFVLTRCKSEPMRSSAKFAPDACFWKNRKLEPHHRPATLGVGAAGVGF